MLFNSWKHHAGVLRKRIREYAQDGEDGLQQLTAQVMVIGHELMDLYLGTLSPAEIAERVLAQLQRDRRVDLEAYREWLDDNGGYAMLTFPDDDTQWVLRMGTEDGRHVHVHPGRWTPQTRRVRANVLKTAILVNAHVRVHDGDPFTIKLVNQVRQQYLDLSPMRKLTGDQGLKPIIELLHS